MITRILHSVFLLFINSLLLAQAPGFKWATQVTGSPNGNQAETMTVLTDSLGNIFTAGHFHGTFDFDPGAGTFYMSTNWTWNIFLTKADSSGNFLWAKQLTGPGDNLLAAFYMDKLQNLYLVGSFRDSVDFDPSPAKHLLAPSSTTAVGMFFMKLDPQANLLWVNQLEPKPSTQTTDYDLTTDSQNNVYISGNFDGTRDFDPGPGISTLTAPTSSISVFILKLNPQGIFTWVKKFDASRISNIHVDGSGNIYTAGWYKGTVDFDPGTAIVNLTSNFIFSGFISKLDNTGSFLWAKQFTSISSTAIYFMKMDCENNIYVSGEFRNNMDADPGAGIKTFTNNTNAFVPFLIKLDPLGNYIWGDQMPKIEAGYLHIDAHQNVYLTGKFVDICDFELGPGTYTLDATGGYKIFMARYNFNGTLAWAYDYASTSTLPGIGSAITTETNGHVIYAGSFTGSTDFDPSPATNILSASSSNLETYLVKFSQTNSFLAAPIAVTLICPGMTTTLNAISSNSLTWYAAPNTTSSVASGSSYITPPLYNTSTFYVVGKGCAAAASTATITVNVSICVDVLDDDERAQPLTIFPNPSSSYFIITGHVESKLALVSLLGRTVIEFSLHTENSFSHRISGLPHGIYLIKDQTSGKVSNQKIVVD